MKKWISSIVKLAAISAWPVHAVLCSITRATTQDKSKDYYQSIVHIVLGPVPVHNKCASYVPTACYVCIVIDARNDALLLSIPIHMYSRLSLNDMLIAKWFLPILGLYNSGLYSSWRWHPTGFHRAWGFGSWGFPDPIAKKSPGPSYWGPKYEDGRCL